MVIDLSEGAAYKELRSRPGVMTLEIENSKLPEELVRTLDVSAYKGSLRAISSYPAPGKRDATLIEVEHAEGASSLVTRRGNALVWSFAPQGKRPASSSGIGKAGCACSPTAPLPVARFRTGGPWAATPLRSRRPESLMPCPTRWTK